MLRSVVCLKRFAEINYKPEETTTFLYISIANKFYFLAGEMAAYVQQVLYFFVVINPLLAKSRKLSLV